MLHIILKRSTFQTKCSKKFFNWAQLGPIADLGPMGRPLRFFLNSPQTLSLANSKIWLKKPTRRLKGKGPYWAPKGPKSPVTTLNVRNPIVLHIILKRSIFQTKCSNKFFNWAHRGPIRPNRRFEPNGPAPTIFLKLATDTLLGQL